MVNTEKNQLQVVTQLELQIKNESQISLKLQCIIKIK